MDTQMYKTGFSHISFRLKQRQAIKA